MTKNKLPPILISGWSVNNKAMKTIKKSSAKVEFGDKCVFHVDNYSGQGHNLAPREKPLIYIEQEGKVIFTGDFEKLKTILINAQNSVKK